MAEKHVPGSFMQRENSWKENQNRQSKQIKSKTKHTQNSQGVLG